MNETTLIADKPKLTAKTFRLSADEIASITSCLDEACQRYNSAESPGFLEEAQLLCQEMPRRLRAFLRDFRNDEEGKAYCLIKGFPIDQNKIGATPAHWARENDISATLREEMFLVLCGMLMGDPIAWATQQDGYLVHDIMPVKKFETEQVGLNSKANLDWHVEDAFHEYRGDYLGMMCMRNPQQAVTVVTSVCDVMDVVENDRLANKLFEPHYVIRPDQTHKKENNIASQTQDDVQSSFEFIEHLEVEPPKIPVFTGDPKSPYMRIDPLYMDQPQDTVARQALETLVRRLDEELESFVFEAGDVAFVDNFRSVHGRQPFQANYDGTDRWLKRINVARDLRKSRGSRAKSTCRKIY